MAEVAGGRRPVAALDLGGTQIRAAVVDGSGTLTGRRQQSAEVERGADSVVERCVGLLRASMAEHEAGGGPSPVALGVSAPGPLDPRRGLLHDPPNMGPTFRDYPLGERLGSALGLPCHVDRDTQVAALAEGRFGAAVGLADYVYLTVSTGVGGAVVSEGRLLRGSRGLAGELGHMLVDVNGRPCGCGATGHLEAYVSGTAIASAAADALAADALAAGAGGAQLARMAREIAPRPLSAADVAAAEEAGDEVAVQVMDAARRAFAAAMVAIVDVFAPQRVIVGGGVALGQGERLLEPAREAVRRLAFAEQAARVEIVPAVLGDDVGLLGAVVLVEERLSE